MHATYKHVLLHWQHGDWPTHVGIQVLLLLSVLSFRFPWLWIQREWQVLIWCPIMSRYMRVRWGFNCVLYVPCMHMLLIPVSDPFCLHLCSIHRCTMSPEIHTSGCWIKPRTFAPRHMTLNYSSHPLAISLTMPFPKIPGLTFVIIITSQDQWLNQDMDLVSRISISARNWPLHHFLMHKSCLEPFKRHKIYYSTVVCTGA